MDGSKRTSTKNTSYRIGLKVASPSISRQIIGVEDAYHRSGREHKGEGFLVPAPGAVPISSPAPPSTVSTIRRAPKSIVVRALPAATSCSPRRRGRAEPDTRAVVTNGADVEVLPPRKLIATIGDQLATYGPRAPQTVAAAARRRPSLVDLLKTRFPMSTRANCAGPRRIDKPFECAGIRWSSTPTRLPRTCSASTLGHGPASQQRCRRSSCRQPPLLTSRRRSTVWTTAAEAPISATSRIGSIATPRQAERIRRSVSSGSCCGRASGTGVR